MAITDFFKKLLKPAQNRLLQAYTRLFGFGMPLYNIEENAESYIKKGYQSNLFVYQCVEFITRKASSVPIKMRRKLKNGEFEDVESHPILDVLNRPNTFQGYSEFIQQALGYKLITGNSYMYANPLGVGSKAKEIVELHVMPADQTIVVTGDNWAEPIKAYILQWAPDRNLEFSPDEIIHLKYPSYDYEQGDYYGQSPLRAALSILEKSNQNIDSAKSAFANQGAAGIITDEAVEEAQGITKEQAEQLQESYTEKFTGSKNKGKVLVTVGRLRWQQIGLSPVDLNMIADHNLTRRDICSVYHLSSNLFNDVEGTTFSNMKEARKAAWTDAIIPELNSVAQELTRVFTKAYKDSSLELYYDYSGVEELQADKAEMANWLNVAWWIKVNRKQEMMGEAPDETMDFYMLPQGLMPYEELPPFTIPPDNDESGAQ
jgi:HK97 family phage portal protein